MDFGIEMAALAALPFAAAMAIAAALAAIDLATGRSVGAWLAILLGVLMIPVMFFFMTQTWEAEFRTEVLALAPITAMIGLFIGYGLRRGLASAGSERKLARAKTRS